jgi:hypothetical protein
MWPWPWHSGDVAAPRVECSWGRGSSVLYGGGAASTFGRPSRGAASSILSGGVGSRGGGGSQLASAVLGTGTLNMEAFRTGPQVNTSAAGGATESA